MNKADLEAFAREAAKHMKTEKDLSDFSQMLTKITVEAALNGEIRILAIKSIKNPLHPIVVTVTRPKN